MSGSLWSSPACGRLLQYRHRRQDCSSQVRTHTLWAAGVEFDVFNAHCYVLVTRTTRFSTFPDYLMIQMAKFSFADDWVPKKYGKG